jgi:hypothetical protein
MWFSPVPGHRDVETLVHALPQLPSPILKTPRHIDKDPERFTRIAPVITRSSREPVEFSVKAKKERKTREMKALDSVHIRRERVGKVAKSKEDIAVDDAKTGKQKKKQITKSEARARSKPRGKRETDQDS